MIRKRFHVIAQALAAWIFATVRPMPGFLRQSNFATRIDLTACWQDHGALLAMQT